MDTVRSRQAGPSTYWGIIAVLALLLFLTAYSVVEIQGLQNQLNFLQNQNYNQQSQLQNLQSELYNLQNQIRSLSTPGTKSLSFRVTSACVSLTAGCGGLMYYIVLSDNGTTSVSKGYGIYLSFKDATRGTFFGFNTSLPQDLSPSQGATVEAATWPPGSGAESNLAQGDMVGVAVTIQGFQAAIGARVLTCNKYATTTVFLNYTGTQTQTWTTQTCT